jgi:uncharacterized membrane protein (UPF0127 family)
MPSRSRATGLAAIVLAAAALTPSACARTEEARLASAPRPSPPPLALPTATLPDGFLVTLELATSVEEISQGLMFRPTLPESRGMLFLFGEERVPAFWMKDTLVPLDIIFLDDEGRVVDIAADARPCPAEPCPNFVPDEPCTAVLELLSGTASAHGVVIGSTLRFDRVEGFPAERAGRDEGEAPPPGG